MAAQRPAAVVAEAITGAVEDRRAHAAFRAASEMLELESDSSHSPSTLELPPHLFEPPPRLLTRGARRSGRAKKEDVHDTQLNEYIFDVVGTDQTRESSEYSILILHQHHRSRTSASRSWYGGRPSLVKQNRVHQVNITWYVTVGGNAWVGAEQVHQHHVLRHGWRECTI